MYVSVCVCLYVCLHLQLLVTIVRHQLYRMYTTHTSIHMSLEESSDEGVNTLCNTPTIMVILVYILTTCTCL